jgi:hypothetical protein
MNEPCLTPPEYMKGIQSGVASVQGEMSLLNAFVREATADVVNARRIMRAILYADERGQGVNFHEAMDAAEAFCCFVEARYVAQLKEQSA